MEWEWQVGGKIHEELRIKVLIVQTGGIYCVITKYKTVSIDLW